MLKIRNDPYDTFDYMLALEDKYGFISSFYFKSRNQYKIENMPDADSLLKRLLIKIENKGCEIGLHGSYESYIEESLLNMEKVQLQELTDSTIVGTRQHYLRFKVPETWRIQAEAGFHYDTTLAYAERCGFRCGLCMPYKPFDVLNNTVLDIWELPLIVMDGSLRGANYENLQLDEAFNRVRLLIDTTEKYHGCFVILWHNSSFDVLSGWGGWKEVYEKIMNYISTRNCWVSTGKEIIEWWQQKIEM
jgi:hypothetical protein